MKSIGSTRTAFLPIKAEERIRTSTEVRQNRGSKYEINSLRQNRRSSILTGESRRSEKSGGFESAQVLQHYPLSAVGIFALGSTLFMHPPTAT
jgi:hypothetical protein